MKSKNHEHSHPNQKTRIAEEFEYQILDSETENIYNQIAKSASHLCNASLATLTFVNKGKVWVKAYYGQDACKLTQDPVFFSHVMLEDHILVVPNVSEDERFAHVEYSSEIVSYLGVPLKDSYGQTWGALCTYGYDPEKLTAYHKEGLSLLVEQVIGVLELRISKLRYETFIEASHDMIYEVNGDGKFTFANIATIGKVGYTRQQLYEMTCWELVVPEYREVVIKYYLDQIRQGKTAIYHEFPIQGKSGNVIWLGQSVDYTLVEGRADKAYVIAKDITELVDTRMKLKETEEQILAEKNLLKTMIFSSPAAIAMFNKDLKYLAYSEKWDAERAINEKVIGVNSADDDSQNELIDCIKEKILRGEVTGQESQLVISDAGDEKWIKWVATPWNNTTDGSIGGIIVYTDDVTHVVNHEAELLRAKEEALKSGQIKEDFLSSMSHEIRTPLNAIIGTTNLLMDESKELANNEKFQLLKFSSNNLLALINNVLDFSKIQSGHIQIENKDFELSVLANSLISSWKPIADQKGIDLILRLDKELPVVVKGDSVRLSQILNNLINNALKFTEEGFVQLKIDGTNDDNTIHFELRDTGIGIPLEKQKDVFESFKQVSSHLSEQSGGTGLGLPICKNLVEMMGSELALKSQEGFGSKFTFDVKFQKGNASNIPQFSSEQEESQLKVNVLLVEDNKANQFIAKSFLKKWGATTTVASNGLEALDKIKSKSFDLVLLDIRMPVMNGYECAKKIREMKDEYFQNIPLIALTASTIVDVRKNGSVKEFNDFLSKPFDPKKLFGILMKHAGKNHPFEKLSTPETEDSKAPNPVLQQELKENISVYTEDDPEFFSEFTENIIENLGKVRSGISSSPSDKSPQSMSDLIHMVKPTIEIIGQTDLMKALTQLRGTWSKDGFDRTLEQKVLDLVTDKIVALDDLLVTVKTQTLTELK